MALTNMHSDLRFNPSSGLCINLVSYLYYSVILYYIILYYITWILYFASWGVIGCLHGEQQSSLEVTSNDTMYTL